MPGGKLAEARDVLRCARCWRNLATVWGQHYHAIFPDGSMRCRAPEGLVAWCHAVPITVDYTSTRVVLDCAERTDRIREVVNFNG